MSRFSIDNLVHFINDLLLICCSLFVTINDDRDNSWIVEAFFFLTSKKMCFFFILEVIDANQWQKWILHILHQLRTFQFCFHFRNQEIIENIGTLFKQFQNDFWLKQHKWYTEYIVLDGV